MAARNRGARRFHGLRCALRYGPVLASSHRPMMPCRSFSDWNIQSHANLNTEHLKLNTPLAAPWHHRSTPSMAPGLSCADRPWIGVPAASHSSLECAGQAFSNFTPEQRWNTHPMFRRVDTGLASVECNARRLDFQFNPNLFCQEFHLSIVGYLHPPTNAFALPRLPLAQKNAPFL